MFRLHSIAAGSRRPALRSISLAAMLAAGGLMLADAATAGGKPPGAKCMSSRSCSTGLCARENAGDKFGSCCQPTQCSQVNAQCGSIDNGCGGQTDCGPCDGACIDNQCIPAPTTTSTTSTTTTTSTTSTTEPPTTTVPPTTTLAPTTTTTVDVTTTTTEPPQTCAADADCGSGCCDISDLSGYQCGGTCCLGCWWMCFAACGCPSGPNCQYCMDNGAGFGCPQSSCGCPLW